MRLSTRLILLGVSGPLISVVIFFVIAAMSSIRLSHQAGRDMARLIDLDNLTRLRGATRLIQATTDETAARVNEGSTTLAARLRGELQLQPGGPPTWRGSDLATQERRDALNRILREGLAAPGGEAALYYSLDGNRWWRLTGVTAQGEGLASPKPAPEPLVRHLRTLGSRGQAETLPMSLLTSQRGQWSITRLTRLANPGGSGRLVLALGLTTDAAANLLSAAAGLFPSSDHEIAFLALGGAGTPECTYAQPDPDSCPSLIQALELSGGIPPVGGDGEPYLMERRLETGTAGRHQGDRTLFISVFPELDWIAVMAVNDTALVRSANPLHSETLRILFQLSGATLILIGFCAVMAWRISEGIRRQLRELAAAAAAIARGERRQAILYCGQDALGRFVESFNQMAGAVAAREENLRSQIRSLEININEQELRGQVCSIVKDPNFQDLSSRARAMRARRHDWGTPMSESSDDQSHSDPPEDRLPLDQSED